MKLENGYDFYLASQIAAQLELCSAASEPEDAYVVLFRRYEDKGWLSAPSEWFQAAAVFSTESSFLELGIKAIESLTTVSFEDKAWLALADELGSSGVFRRAWAECTISSLVSSLPRMAAGQARLVARFITALFECIDLCGDVAWDALTKSVDWLLTNGAAELRAPDNSTLLGQIVAAMHRDSRKLTLDLTRAQLLTKFVLSHAGAFHYLVTSGRFAKTLSSLRDVGQEPVALDYLAIAAARSLLPQLAKVESPEDMEWLIGLWRSGVVIGKIPFPSTQDDLDLLSAEVPTSAIALAPAVQFLEAFVAGRLVLADDLRNRWVEHLNSRGPRLLDLTSPDVNIQWARLAASFYSTHTAPSVILKNTESLATGAVSAHLQATVETIRAGSVKHTPAVLRVLLRQIAEEVSVKDTLLPAGDDWTRFRAPLEKLVTFAWPESIFGIPAQELFAGFTAVHIEALAAGDLVSADPSRRLIRLDEWYVRKVAKDTRLVGPEQLALVCLYFLHEYIHHVQHVATKQQVAHLRLAGAESALMHIDLGADHAATLMANAAFPGWTIAWLKELQARSLTDFPTSELYPEAARSRKATRRASILANSLVLQMQNEPVQQYLHLEFAPVGGRFALMASGPPLRVMGDCDISFQEVQVLESCADEVVDTAAQTERLRGTLQTLIERCGLAELR